MIVGVRRAIQGRARGRHKRGCVGGDAWARGGRSDDEVIDGRDIGLAKSKNPVDYHRLPWGNRTHIDHVLAEISRRAVTINRGCDHRVENGATVDLEGATGIQDGCFAEDRADGEGEVVRRRCTRHPNTSGDQHVIDGFRAQANVGALIRIKGVEIPHLDGRGSVVGERGHNGECIDSCDQLIHATECDVRAACRVGACGRHGGSGVGDSHRLLSNTRGVVKAEGGRIRAALHAPVRNWSARVEEILAVQNGTVDRAVVPTHNQGQLTVAQGRRHTANETEREGAQHSQTGDGATESITG